MARAMIDASLNGRVYTIRVYTIDVIDHHAARNWHSSQAGKQDADEPLADIAISRARIWKRWFPDEADRISPITGRSWEILNAWSQGEIDVAFLDGAHTYEAIRKELSFLDALMTPAGVILLDDYHPGMDIFRVRSRMVNGCIRKIVAPVLRKIWPAGGERLRLGTDNEFALVKQRYSGIRKAVREFLEESGDRWSLAIISRPARGAYQVDDYSLALLTRR